MTRPVTGVWAKGQCHCIPEIKRTCGWHYSELKPVDQEHVRRLAGIKRTAEQRAKR